jgi:hypothetical protein
MERLLPPLSRLSLSLSLSHTHTHTHTRTHTHTHTHTHTRKLTQTHAHAHAHAHTHSSRAARVPARAGPTDARPLPYLGSHQGADRGGVRGRARGSPRGGRSRGRRRRRAVCEANAPRHLPPPPPASAARSLCAARRLPRPSLMAQAVAHARDRGARAGAPDRFHPHPLLVLKCEPLCVINPFCLSPLRIPPPHQRHPLPRPHRDRRARRPAGRAGENRKRMEEALGVELSFSPRGKRQPDLARDSLT